MNDSTLRHHGIKGMRWGVRRYQNKDGASTSAGKKRTDNSTRASSMSDADLSAAVKRLNLENSYNKLSGQNGKSSKLEKTKKLIDASSNAVNQAKNAMHETSSKSKSTKKMDLSQMSDKDLRDRINRSNLERQYNDLFGGESVSVSRGQKFISNVLEIGGSALAIGGSALGIALAIKELRS